MLELLSPGRVDLGIGRAPGTDQRTSRALQAGPEGWSIDAFPSQLHLLRQFLEDASGGAPIPDDHPYRGIHAMPSGSSPPEMWLLGSGIHSAVYAAEFGMGYSHAHFIGPDTSEEACQVYRDRFKAGGVWPAPQLSLGVSALAAESEEEARFLAASRDLWVVRLLSGRPIAFPSPREALDYPYTDAERALLDNVQARSIVGTAETVHRRLTSLAERHAAQELVIVTITHDFAPRRRSYELLARAFGLEL